MPLRVGLTCLRVRPEVKTATLDAKTVTAFAKTASMVAKTKAMLYAFENGPHYLIVRAVKRLGNDDYLNRLCAIL